MLTLLNEGASAEDAATQAGVSVPSLVASAVHDGELRAALNGQPPAVQRAARKGDFIAALTRTGGVVKEAALLTGIDMDTVREWRTEDPAYAGVEDAVVRWITSMRPTKRPVTLTDQKLNRAAALLEQGATIKAAAEAVGASGQGLRQASVRHARLAAALPPLREPSTPRGRPSGLTPKVEEDFRRMWADRSMSLAVMGGRLGVSPTTLKRWARDLQLPARDRRVGRRWREEPPARKAQD
ncbi:hypothetical protein AB0900_30850 [Streptomyces cellulosae]